jgi:hypothetical protein
MKAFVESLSLGSGAILVAILSVGVVWLLCFVGPVALRKLWVLWVVIVPVIVAHCLYWCPVWLGADAFEAGGWEPFVVVPWFLAGAIPSFAIVLILRDRRSA